MAGALRSVLVKPVASANAAVATALMMCLLGFTQPTNYKSVEILCGCRLKCICDGMSHRHRPTSVTRVSRAKNAYLISSDSKRMRLPQPACKAVGFGGIFEYHTVGPGMRIG
jgi:hypothetical protein